VVLLHGVVPMRGVVHNVTGLARRMFVDDDVLGH
jgi:hypothetical protein